MVEVDLLSRYNAFAQVNRPAPDTLKETAVFTKLAIPSGNTVTNWPVDEVGTGFRQTPLTKIANISRVIWNIEAAFSTLRTATEVGLIDAIFKCETEESSEWNQAMNSAYQYSTLAQLTTSFTTDNSPVVG